MKKTVTVPMAGEHGVIYDVDSTNLPINAWSNGLNYKIKNGSILTVNGRQQIAVDPVAKPQHILALENDTSEFYLYTGWDTTALPSPKSVICILNENASHTDVSPVTDLTSAEVVTWHTDTYGEFALVTNNVDVPHSWVSGAANAVPLVNWPATYKAATIASYKGFIVTGNITKAAVNSPQLIKWSTQADPGLLPGSWDETDPTVLAGENELKGSGGAIVDMQVLNDTLYIYRETAVDTMTFIGGTLVFAFKQLFTGWGPIADNCVATLGRMQWIFANNDLLMHDGSTYQSLVEGKQRERIFNQIDGLNQEKCFVTTNNSENEVWFCYPVSGDTSATRAFTYNFVTGETGERELSQFEHATAGRKLEVAGSEWDNDNRFWNDADENWNANQAVGTLNLYSISAENLKIFAEDEGFDNNGVDIESYFERQDILIPGESPMATVTITEVTPMIEAQNVISTTDLNVLVGNKHTVTGGLIWSTYTFNPATEYEVHTRKTGKLPSFRFYWRGKGQLKVNGYNFTYVTRGRR